MDETVKHYGRLDVLINNAGATRARNIDTCTIEDLDWCYNVLVRSVFMMSKAAIPHLEKTKGAILNMSSLAGLRPVSILYATEFIYALKSRAKWTLSHILRDAFLAFYCHELFERYKTCFSKFIWNVSRRHFVECWCLRNFSRNERLCTWSHIQI